MINLKNRNVTVKPILMFFFFVSYLIGNSLVISQKDEQPNEDTKKTKEAVVQTCSVKMVFLEISQNS